MEIKLDRSDLDFIENALNFYWNDAKNNLTKRDLGDIERNNYEYQLMRSKELLIKIEDR